ncbi:MAG: AFG1 family ATPase [Alphaproteobacteria bacterium]|nr:AFG1 family ATPase [Alphaproteobacteria bacterium]QQS56881.1 MAG: AFG1 family ATPase [Alphaproteobacteria bacterium]
MTHTPLSLYSEKLLRGELHLDPAQGAAVKSLQRLYDELLEAEKKPRMSFFEKVSGKGKAEASPLGVYLHGGVGRGKSMLMDLFFSCLPLAIGKRRVHFHEFMIEVHDYIHTRRSEDTINGGAVDQALPSLGELIFQRSKVLCFDEFHITDVADAMILGRLFRLLFEKGVVVVATSNWPPDRLYEGGLQRERFLPFIALMKEKMEIVHLDSPHDYRARALAEEGTYFTPLGRATEQKMDALFGLLTGQAPALEEKLFVKGRRLPVRTAKGVARFTFSQLCEQPLGAEDYVTIARNFHTVLLENVPALKYDRRNEAKRLMNLIDALYDKRVRVVISAETRPEKLYAGHDHSFEFQRTISRLQEMQSEGYP